jgi:hypothetical protein
MRRRIPGVRVLPFGGGMNLLLVGGVAYFAWEHEQGRHDNPHVLCLICWMDKVAPAPRTPGDSSPSEPPESA